MRVSVALALCCLGTLSFAADPAHASIRKDLNVPAEDLSPALQTVATTYEFQVLYATNLVKDVRTQGAVGTLTTDEAMKKVLNGTGLTYKFLDSNTITVFATSVPAAAAAPADQTQTPKSTKEGQNNSNSFRVAQVDQGKSAGVAAVGNTTNSAENSSAPSAGLSEIIVTAQKRSERAQDVPVPVTSINASLLVDSGESQLQDYYTRIPGLNLTTGTRGEPLLAIRGVTTGGYTNPTVGIIVDDVPYGSTASLGGGSQVPDIDPSDLARIEVLRGPQGTLYGANSMGGLVKYVTVDPSTDGYSGRVEAGTSGVHNGAEAGYSFRGSINVPITDTLAARASGFTRQEPGYIDNVLTGQDGVNEARISGGHLALLWRPSDAVSLKLSALYQDSKTDGSSLVDLQPGLGDLQQSAVRGTGGYDRTTQAYSSVLTAKLGSVNVTALSGYSINSIKGSEDLSNILGPAFGLDPSVAGVPYHENISTDKFSQEIRLSAPIGERFDWLLGAFYTHEQSQFLTDITTADPITGMQLLDFGGQNPADFKYTEYSAFADLTVRLSDQFDVQIGGRESHNKQNYISGEIGPILPTFLYPEQTSHDNAFTYLVTPRFKFSEDLMVYARLASGYRPGGPNVGNTVYVPPYQPDKTQNYEIGTKGSVLNHLLSFDFSVYYIDWKDIQLLTFNQQTTVQAFINGTRAKSEGVELSVEAKPIDGLTISTWVAYNNAVLTQAFPMGSTVFGVPGDRLPYSSRFSGNFSLERDFPLGNKLTGFAGGLVSYVGDRKSEFTAATVERQDLPGYTTADLRAGVKYDLWTANVYVDNVGDRRGLLNGDVTNPHAFGYIRPRTVGLLISRIF